MGCCMPKEATLQRQIQTEQINLDYPLQIQPITEIEQSNQNSLLLEIQAIPNTQEPNCEYVESTTKNAQLEINKEIVQVKNKYDLPLSHPVSEIYYEEINKQQKDPKQRKIKKKNKKSQVNYNTLWELLKTNHDKQILSEPLPEFKLNCQQTLEMIVYDPEEVEVEPKQRIFEANQEQSISIDSKDALDINYVEPDKEPSQKQILLQSSRGEKMVMSFAPKFIQNDSQQHIPSFGKAVSLDQDVIKIANEHVVKLLEQLEPIKEHFLPDIIALGPYVIIETSDIYVGQWFNGLRHGFGRQVYENGSYYEGSWEHDLLNGFGRLIYQNGDYYTGEFVDSLKNGKGTIVYNDGSTHEGYWLKNIKNGECKEMAADSSIFTGQYVNGLRNGNCRVDYNDGSIFVGEFKDGYICGKGVQTWPDGRRYDGTWMDDMMDGEGLFVWDEIKKYKGGYLQNKRHGYGEYFWPDGKIYKGGWKNGSMHGEGLMIYPDQKLLKGVWKHGQRQFDKKELEKLKKHARKPSNQSKSKNDNQPKELKSKTGSVIQHKSQD